MLSLNLKHNSFLLDNDLNIKTQNIPLATITVVIICLCLFLIYCA